jgi:hypothetical protein
MWIFRRLWHTFIGKCRKLKGRCQRFIRGWADEDTWCINYWFVETLIPMMKEYRKGNNGYPFELTEEEWDNIVDDMIYYLEGMTEEGATRQLYGKEQQVTQETIRETYNYMRDSKDKFFELFAKYFENLWW